MPETIDYPIIGAKYRHYKGGEYEVITMATHTETQEKMVVYKSLFFGSIYVRPLSMWFEILQDEGTTWKYRRFKLIEQND